MKTQSNTKSSHHSAAFNQGTEARRKLLVSYRNTNQFDMKHAPGIPQGSTEKLGHKGYNL